ncbi:hypothetical protein COCSUDRAFT_23789 [Coccomyxa subellipsoidea C-169]|uniref:Uncharacterized protein n=1 Tax=Coccomyxa subellipsoidea (strain C-169) TaxID=574566 RepID=I0YXP2_COCSC|nr:hypothetical protein COCSUDRAFT_23789 [Coccomyxa subellipsoidea C-169]EIE23161.1 hypothetical protein COCSUDRAFT_23789 [Coccomyxa subellipsoidea C-169]|eukprot:XP_005647705.1 hypothetical protein COCSUDRAFT_23789 [Coccomyxa subellipsoidea C-169]
MAQALSNSTMCSIHSVSRREAYRQQTALPSLAHCAIRRNSRRSSTSPQALSVGGVADDFGLTSGSSAVNILLQAATFAAIGVAAWFTARLVDQAPEQREDETGECPRCSGSGFEECICTRWSDNDAGCATCNGSSRMACRSCGGGGTAVPATAKIVARRGSNYIGR